MHESTSWRLQPSLMYDMLCLLNILTGEPFYTQYYPGVYEAFVPRLPVATHEAVRHMKQVIRDEGKGIVGAAFTLLFSVVEPEPTTLAAMIEVVQHPDAMKRGFMASIYADEMWGQFEATRGDLLNILEALQAMGYEDEWRAKILPLVEQRIAELAPEMERYNIVPAVEQRLGFAIDSNEIGIYLLYYSKPHGIKVTGSRFLNGLEYPLKIFVWTAIHEMMHPPYFLKRDPAMQGLIERLEQDPFLKAALDDHDQTFGYNSFDGMIEEGVVRALDQIVSEQFGEARDPRKRWKDEDGGMHVMAVVLYALLKDAGPIQPIRDFLLDAEERGDLRTPNIQAIYERFYGEEVTPHP